MKLFPVPASLSLLIYVVVSMQRKFILCFEIICCVGEAHCMCLQVALLLKTLPELHLFLWYGDVLKGTKHVTIKGWLLCYAAFKTYPKC